MDSPSAGWIKQVSNLTYLGDAVQRGRCTANMWTERMFILVKSGGFNLRKPLGLGRELYTKEKITFKIYF